MHDGEPIDGATDELGGGDMDRARLDAMIRAATTAFMVAATAWSGTAAAKPDAAYEGARRAELAAVAPDAVADWDQANADRQANRIDAARAGYRRVVDRAPRFDAALRRLCSIEPDPARAVATCRRAIALRRSWENEAALAVALLHTSTVDTPNLGEADSLADAALRDAPDEPSVLAIDGEIALARDDVARFDRDLTSLRRVAPDAPETYLTAIDGALAHGDPAAAQREVSRAEAAHAFPPEDVALLRAHIVEVSRPSFTARAVTLAERIAAAWVVCAGALLLLGIGLSRATVRAAAQTDDAGDGSAIGGTAHVKRAYAAVIGGASLFFYLSLPLVVVAEIAVFGALLYACFAIGRIPIKLVLVAFVVLAVSLAAIVRSVWIVVFPKPPEDPGLPIERGRFPRLDRLLADVAARMETRAVDRVFLSTGAEVAVFERGNVVATALGRGQRCLVLGAAVLDGLRIGALRAVLAHEYGHLKNEDTSGGSFSFAVRRSMNEMLGALAKSGAATWYNPAWLFAKYAYLAFVRLTHGATRLQEVLADRWAVSTCGGAAFAEGLEHVIRRSIAFDAHIEKSLDEILGGKARPLANLYTYRPEKAAAPDEIARIAQQALEREASAYDSHPAPRERIRAAHARDAGRSAMAKEAGDDDEAWHLLDDRAALEAALTERLCERVLDVYGVTVRRAPAEAAGATTAVETGAAPPA